MQNEFRTGFSKVKITPPIEVGGMVGVERVIEDVYARSTVISSGGQTIAIVLLDLMAIDRSQAEPIRRDVCRALGIPPEALMIACTHNHSCAHLTSWMLLRPDPRKTQYLEFLRQQVVEGVRQAREAQQPATWSWARGRVTDLARNRRLKTPDGKVRTLRRGDPASWPLMDDPAVTAGPVDEELLLLVARDGAGVVRGLLANFGCHNTLAMMANGICPDVFGVAMAELEQPAAGVTAMITNGAEGNVDATKTIPHLGPRDFGEAQRGGKSLAGQIAGLIAGAQPLRGGRLSAAWAEASFPVNDVFREIAAGRREFVYPGLFHSEGPMPAFAAAAQTGRMPGVVQRLSLGEATLIGLPGEIFSETQLRIKAMRPGLPTFVLGVTNEYLGYIPTAEAMAEGGYDATPSEWIRLTGEAEAIILEHVKGLMRGEAGAARPAMALRTVRPSDVPRLKEIVAMSWKDQGIAHILEKRYGVMGGKPWLEWKWPQVEKACRETPDQVLVTEADGEVAGFAVYLLDHARKTGTVGNNAVDPKFRGLGIGKRQIARILEILREKGMTFAEVTVALNEGHAAARAVYEKAGFEPISDSRYMFMRLD